MCQCHQIDDFGEDFPQAGGHLPIPEPDDLPDELHKPVPATLEELELVQKFIREIKDATLDADNLPPSVIERLRNPSNIPASIADKAMHSGIDLFISMSNETETAFDKARDVFNRTLVRLGLEDDQNQIPTLFKVKEEILQITGVYPMMHDMCPNSCMAYTGPLSDKTSCIKCAHPRYDPEVLAASGGRDKKPQRQFLTLPIGTQLQAMWRTEEGGKNMRYRRDLTRDLLADAQQFEDKKIRVDTYEDIFHGSAYLERVYNGNIREDDMVLMLSIDGAQLYESKQSDCWIYIWVIMDLSPDKRYKKRHIFPGGFFPGPNKPGNMESFLFPGFHHLSALMKEGLQIWDAYEKRQFLSYLLLILGLADGPGLTYLNGLTGHSGAFGCRLFCPIKGRRKDGGNHYYPALLKPENYTVEHCDHGDIPTDSVQSIGNPAEYNACLNLVLASKTSAEYQRNRRMTGISRPSIFSSLPETRTLPTPLNNGTDLMHLASLNITDALLSHWRGTMECDPMDNKASWVWAVVTGDVWKAHGHRVANAKPYLPGSFDRPPRNPAEKISSGYKAWEFLTYIYSLGPGLLLGVLPEPYWKNYCKLVMGIRILHQRRITRAQLLHAYTLLLEFVTEYELLYFQKKSYRLHFCQQSIHALLHLAPEVARLGPPVIYTQWPMERTIGNLGQEIFQHSQFFANLAQRGTRRAQVNAILAMMPAEFPDPSVKTSKRQRSTSILPNSYVLSMPEERGHPVSLIEVNALRHFLTAQDETITIPDNVKLRRWARLQLPNLQFVRTAWKEIPKGLKKCRMSRNVMVCNNEHVIFLVLYSHLIQFSNSGRHDSDQQFAEVQYFFQIEMGGEILTVALISKFGPPDPNLLAASSGALMVCQYQGVASLEVIQINKIISCIAMVPFTDPPDGRFFVCEKMGLDMAFLGGIQEQDAEDEDAGKVGDGHIDKLT